MELLFLRPAVGWLLLAVPLIWFLPSRPRTILHGVMRTLVLALVIAALMQPVVVSNLSREHHAIILDRSASVAESGRDLGAKAAARLMRRLQDRGTVTVIQVGGGSAISGNAVTLGTRSSGESPLADAIELAAGSIPHGMSGALTLISDGLATDRNWGRAIDQLLDRGIPVHTCQLPRQPDDPFLAGIRSTEVRAGESVSVFVDVVGAGSGFEVLLTSGDEVLARSRPFTSGGRRRVELQFEAGGPGFIDVAAALSAPPDVDRDPGNNRLDHVIAVQDPVRVLYLGERLAGAADKLSALLGPGFDVASAVPADLPGRVDLSDCDVVMLDDVPARSLAEGAQEDLANAVENEGIGLFHSGGEAAFGDGGYFDTPVAEILPVELPGDEDRIDPSVGLAIILDTSGSMGGTRIELAKQIARTAVRRMQPHDRIGIVEFYGNKHWAVPMQPASNKIEIDRAIGRMKAVGGTVLYPAIQEAYYGLKNVNTRFKHILIITDAGVEDSNYEAVIRRISKDRINLSTILVGQGGHNLIMSDMANWGQGRFYAVGDQFSLVELILKQPSVEKPPGYRRGIFSMQALGGPGWWGEVDNREIPPLDGYVEVELRDGAEVLLEEKRNKNPILATWRYGLGRVTVLMTEPAGAGTQRWSAWDGYAEFLGRVISRTAADHTEFDLALNPRRGFVTLTAQRNDRREPLKPVAYLVDPAGRRLFDRTVEFKQFAPGLFEADLAAPATAAVRVVVEAANGGRRQRARGRRAIGHRRGEPGGSGQSSGSATPFHADGRRGLVGFGA